ncbi:MAG: hypothetical protein LQ342_001034 [Letrouitia transgressa]|nr:MAG: hypothetical protein LQ342_001034 [Letrouitia transgressa]
MGAFITLLFVYVLGGITFLPLVLGLVILHAYLWFPHVVDATGPPAEPPGLLPDPKEDGQDLGSVTGLSDFGGAFVRDREPDVAAGYFAVCREYVPGGVNGKPPERVTPVAAVAVTESPSVYQSMYKSIFDRSQSPTIESRKGSGKSAKRARNVFYVVLRHGHLMLYDDSEQVEVRHVVSLEHHDVSIYGGEEAIPESELWIKRNAICLTRKPGLEDGITTSKPFYLFSENCSDKEDFYFALLQNQEVRPNDSQGPLRPQGFETKDIITLVQKLHSSEEQQQTRWLNALVGRLFLALYKSPEMEDFVRKKISKKIMRVKKPVFLTGIVLKKVGMGDSAPCITNPRLKDLTVDGDCCAEADVKYSGNFRLEIATTARLDLGPRFRVREVNLILAVVVRKLEGHALLKFKAPPSNRVWISFETMPDLNLEIEPIVSSRQITYGIILRTIESRIREVIAETIILPHWDDIPFTDTSGHHYRGGIWAQGLAESLSLPIPVEKDTANKENGKDIDIPSPSPPQGLTQPTDGEAMSLPATPTSAAPQLIPRKAVTSALTLGDEEHVDTLGQSTSTGAQKRSEPPKAIRSRSFAAAAGPLVGMNHANVESAKIEKTVSQQNATTAMKAISHRSRPTSPTETWNESAPSSPSLWDQNKHNMSLTLPQTNHPDVAGPVPSSSPPTPTGTTSLTTESIYRSEEPQGVATVQEDHQSPTSTRRKQSLGSIESASAVAAKIWSWSVFDRAKEHKQQQGSSPKPKKAGTLERPIGRGRPLPPPGQPLPRPDRAESRWTRKDDSQEKEPSSLRESSQRPKEAVIIPQDNQSARSARRQSASRSESEDTPQNLMVVRIPSEPQPTSPSEKDGEQFIEKSRGLSSDLSDSEDRGPLEKAEIDREANDLTDSKM